MKPLTAEWVANAEGDFATAQRELRARKNPNYDASCFHSQQCAEKYLKARLEEAGIAFPLTHNLVVLLNLLLSAEPNYASLHNAALALGNYAVTVRYPGLNAVRADARDALALCRQVRSLVRQSLNLP